MKTPFLTAAVLLSLPLAACGPVIDSYADRHLESPTNTIQIPAQGYVVGSRAYSMGEQTPRAAGELVDFTTDGQPGYVVCQHYLTSANQTMDLVIYDKPVVVGTNVIHKLGRFHCLREGDRIKGGAAPQDLHPTTMYVSNDPSRTLGAAGSN